MFHKTVHMAWNFFNLSEQSLENSTENPISRFSVVHLENSRTWISLYETIFSKLKHYYYNLSLYIPIHTTKPQL